MEVDKRSLWVINKRLKRIEQCLEIVAMPLPEKAFERVIELLAENKEDMGPPKCKKHKTVLRLGGFCDACFREKHQKRKKECQEFDQSSP